MTPARCAVSTALASWTPVRRVSATDSGAAFARALMTGAQVEAFQREVTAFFGVADRIVAAARSAPKGEAYALYLAEGVDPRRRASTALEKLIELNDAGAAKAGLLGGFVLWAWCLLLPSLDLLAVAAGGPLDPHGLLNPDGPDEGDLPNVFANADGSVNAEVSSETPLTGEGALKDGDGSALIIHANEDDHTTQPIGGAGARIACAVIK